MKYVLLTFLWSVSFSALANVVGTWVYSGSGCRNASLDADSHVSRAPESSEVGGTVVDEAVFVFKSDGTASMDAVFSDGERSKESGTYTLQGDDLTINEWDADLRVVDGRILIHDSEGDSLCSSNQKFVYILAPVD